jgi:hypothetical protein
MSMKLRILATLLVGIPAGFAVVGSTSQPAIAQEDAAPQLFRPTETPQEAMEREFFDHEKTILRGRDLGGVAAAAHLIGVPRFSENGIIEDSASVHRLYRYLQEQQSYSAPTLRAADLNSPFNTSVQFLPLSAMSQGSSVVPGFERPTMPTPVPVMPTPDTMLPGPAMPDAAPSARPPVQGKF